MSTADAAAVWALAYRIYQPFDPAFAEEMRAILADENKLYGVIKTELLEVKNRFGDERRTRLVQDMGEIDIEDLIEDEMSVITMTHLNYIKRIPLSTYKSQNRGGKGIIGLQTRDEDAVKNLFLSSNHSYLLFFTNLGKVYRIKTWEIPEAGRNAKGTPIINVLASYVIKLNISPFKTFIATAPRTTGADR